MVCRSSGDGRVEVSREGRDATSSLPERMVFAFDALLEQEVNQTVDSGDQAKGEQLWLSARQHQNSFPESEG